MKLTLKLNLGNFEMIDFETNEYDNIANCYSELSDFLGDWVDYTSSAVKLKAHIESKGIVSVLKQEEGEKYNLSPNPGDRPPDSCIDSEPSGIAEAAMSSSTPVFKSTIDWIIHEGKKYKDCKYCGNLVSWNHDSNNYDHFTRGFKYLCPKCTEGT